MTKTTLAAGLAGALRARGTRRAFGVPGGGSSLDLIDALAERGIEFVLSHTETAAAIMAAVTAELSGAPGAVITGVGPGAASAANGVAYAWLERAPVLLLTDRAGEAEGLHDLHQKYDQNALFAPITKASRAFPTGASQAEIDALLDRALDWPQGPIHLDLTVESARSFLNDAPPRASPAEKNSLDQQAIDTARALCEKATLPLIIAGLEARGGTGPAALQALAAALDCPVMTSYKAKGVFSESSERAIGCFTGAAAEHAMIREADLVILFGYDPIEAIPHRWQHTMPMLALSPVADHTYPATPSATLHGALDDCVTRLRDLDRRSAWSDAKVASLRSGLRKRLAMVPSAGVTVETVVDAMARTWPAHARVAVDAGAHMFSVLNRWLAEVPFGVLKSNGLSTMGFALPAAIASSLEEPERPIIAVTGDGGVMMCVAELASAVRAGCDLTVVVCNDAALSLIDIKQQQQQRPRRGVAFGPVDYAGIANAMGCHGVSAESERELESALQAALTRKGPSLIDVRIDAAPYGEQLQALRG